MTSILSELICYWSLWAIQLADRSAAGHPLHPEVCHCYSPYLHLQLHPWHPEPPASLSASDQAVHCCSDACSRHHFSSCCLHRSTACTYFGFGLDGQPLAAPWPLVPACDLYPCRWPAFGSGAGSASAAPLLVAFVVSTASLAAAGVEAAFLAPDAR